jgi:hypothetical protein
MVVKGILLVWFLSSSGSLPCVELLEMLNRWPNQSGQPKRFRVKRARDRVVSNFIHLVVRKLISSLTLGDRRIVGRLHVVRFRADLFTIA